MLEIDPQAKILVASGYQRHPISEDPQRFGAAGFLGKPFRFEALHASILNCLQ
jgi:DNA-binding NarL/FixJ family response regulator